MYPNLSLFINHCGRYQLLTANISLSISTLFSASLQFLVNSSPLLVRVLYDPRSHLTIIRNSAPEVIQPPSIAAVHPVSFGRIRSLYKQKEFNPAARAEIELQLAADTVPRRGCGLTWELLSHRSVFGNPVRHDGEP